MSENKWYLRTQDETFGPETEERLVEWARLGRIQPGQEISDDNIVWQRVEEVPFLDMRFSIDIGDGNPRGPFNKAAAQALIASGRLPPISKMVEVREPFAAEDKKVEESEKPDAAETSVEKEKVAERVVEKEVVREVPVEKIVEKIVVDETRVKDLEGLLGEERRHTAELQARLDEASRNASEATRAAADREAKLQSDLRAVVDREAKLQSDLRAASDREAKLGEDLREAAKAAAERESKLNEEIRAAAESAAEREAKLQVELRDATERETKLAEQVQHLEDELRRLPQAASEVADIQAAVYSLMTGEAEQLAQIVEIEKREFEEVKKRYQERSDRLIERRREILKRAGANIEDMTRKALVARPEDPRTVQLRKELDDERRARERDVNEAQAKVRELNERLRVQTAESMRAAEGMKDMTQLLQEVEGLRDVLKVREKELLEVRQHSEELERQQATRQQTLMARLASLESPSIGNASTLSTNQSREAKQVKLPGWMRFKK